MKCKLFSSTSSSSRSLLHNVLIEMYRQRLEKELKQLQESPGPGVSCWRHEDKLQELRAQITGPEDTPYSEGVFLLSLSIPDRYPFEPPHVRFLTPVYHPNIDSDGRICLDTLKMQPQGSWAPAVNINTLLLTIRVLLAYPNPADGLVADITEQYKRDLASFREDARRMTLKHAVISAEDDGGGKLPVEGRSDCPGINQVPPESRNELTGHVNMNKNCDFDEGEGSTCSPNDKIENCKDSDVMKSGNASCSDDSDTSDYESDDSSSVESSDIRISPRTISSPSCRKDQCQSREVKRRRL